MNESMRFRVVFFRSESGVEPVRDWLKELQQTDRKVIGEDIKTVQFGWPLGLPLVRKLKDDLWEERSPWIAESLVSFLPSTTTQWFYCTASLRSAENAGSRSGHCSETTPANQGINE